jgi:DNA-binding LytR/AlgR family response regulator
LPNSIDSEIVSKHGLPPSPSTVYAFATTGTTTAHRNNQYKQVRIDYSDVLYFESQRDYVAIHLNNNSKALTLQSLSSFERELPPAQFTRIHKSYIISLSKIKQVEKNGVLVNGKTLPVGSTFKTRFEQALH